jgi:hypothetical protein
MKVGLMKIAWYVLIAPICALWGVWTSLRYLVRVFRWWRAARRAMDDTLICPNGHRNSVIGRFECHRCHAVFHGWIGDPCRICGATSSWSSCEQCGIAIRFPWGL